MKCFQKPKAHNYFFFLTNSCFIAIFFFLTAAYLRDFPVQAFMYMVYTFLSKKDAEVVIILFIQ